MGISLRLPVQSLAALGYMFTGQTTDSTYSIKMVFAKSLSKSLLVSTHLIRVGGGIKNFFVGTNVERIEL